MNLHELQQKIKNFNFDFLKYINPETKELNNKVILFSSIIIFLNFNYFTISELEITGLKIIIEKNVLTIMLILINSYYFLQFYMSMKIDILLAKIPNEFTQICEIVNSKIDVLNQEMAQITIEYQTIAKNKDFDEETLKLLNERYEIAKNDNTVEILNNWQKRISEALKYHDRNQLLNFLFPIFWYSVSVLSIILVYIKKE